MYRGGAGVAAPSSRPPGRLNILFQQPGGVSQQTAGGGPLWRRAGLGPEHQSPPPPPQTINSELKQKWSAGLNTGLPEVSEGAAKPVDQSFTQWKRKQEPEKKPEEFEKKVEPVWKRIRETERKQEPERKKERQKEEKQRDTEQTMERRRPEPMWKKKQEPGRLEVKAESEKNSDPVWKRKEVAKVQELANKQEPDKKPGFPKRLEPQKIETVTKLEPLWKRKFETVKTTEPVVKNGPGTKLEPIWRRKIKTETKQELEIKNEPPKKTEPLWKRKKELEKVPEFPSKPDQLSKRVQEEEKKTEAVSEDEAKHSTEDLPEDETEILCPMCSELFDEEEQQPILLPRCGHTFCRSCLITVKGKGHFPCPTCRKRHLKPPVEDLPYHSEVLSRAIAYRENKMGKCKTHQELLIFWCRNCQARLCSTCRVAKGHDVVRTKVVLQEKRQEMKEKAETILENVLQEKQKIMDSVKTYSAQLLKVCEASVAVDDSSQDVKEMLSDTKQTADLSFVFNSLQRMKSILGSFSKTASDSEKDKNKTNKVSRTKQRCLSQQNGNVIADKESKIPEKKVTSNPAGNKMNISLKNEKGVRTETEVHKNMDMRISHQQPTAGRVLGNVLAEVTTQGPLLSMAEASLWPLTCCVYGEDGRRARLSWERGILHMSALSENEKAAHFMIKLSVIQSVIPQDHPEVFLEVEAGERLLGRIYIKLWGHLRRAHHFLALCMGTHGPSYRGAKFEEVFSRGLRGECLHAGPYLTSSGDLSAQRVMGGLEWDGQFKGPQQKGLVVGAGSGRPDREACFDICTIENPSRHFACPFGEVVDGWDTVMAIIDFRPVRAVTMVDVGVVVPGAALPPS